MALTELNHYLLVAKNLERTKDFYCNVLGLELADRPDFGFPGYWLKIGDDDELFVHRDETHLRRSGTISLGQAHQVDDADLIWFQCGGE